MTKKATNFAMLAVVLSASPKMLPSVAYSKSANIEWKTLSREA